MPRCCPACDRAEPEVSFPTPRAKNCVECAALPARRRRPIPADWRARCAAAEAATGERHAVDHIVPMNSRTRPTHEVESVLVCGLDAEQNWRVIPAGQNAAKRWTFSAEHARAEEARLIAWARDRGL
jgi:hypothetical protein